MPDYYVLVVSFLDRPTTHLMSHRPHTLRLLGTASAVVLAITLTLGLWPFHAPRNNVNWMKEANGLGFNRYGSIFSLSPISPSKATDSAARTIEIWVRAPLGHS